MRITGLGRILFAVSFAAAGALLLAWHDFARAWQPLPKWLPGYGIVVPAYGAILLASGLALLIPRLAKPAALGLTGLLLLRLLLLPLPHVIAHPLIEGTWEELSESLIYVAGGWTIFSMLPRGREALAALGNIRVGQMLFALALPAIGLSHIIYLDQTAPLIPSWLPFHVPLAYITGAAHIAAGVAILVGVLPRLAATLEAAMVSLFTLLVWVPALIAAPASAANWSEICVSAAITGAAWAVAESFRAGGWRRMALPRGIEPRFQP